jgi:dihydroneopterin aldolase
VSPAPDRIVLRRIAATGRHGVLDFEKERAQPFEVDVELELDLAPAAKADDLDLTSDYGGVVAAVVAVVETESFRLVEALAERLADVVIQSSRADAVTIEVRKMRPPVPHLLESAGVRIRRTATPDSPTAGR